jgi:chromosome segregation ATPase
LQDIIAKAESAENRRKTAEADAVNIEHRNRLKAEELNKDFEDKRSKLSEAFERVQTEKQQVINELNVNIDSLNSQVDSSNKKVLELFEKLEVLRSETGNLVSQNIVLDNDISAKQGELDKLRQDSTDETQVYKERANELTTQIAQLSITRKQIESDNEILRATQEQTENTIMELDSSFKLRKEVTDKQLADAQVKLNTILNTLQVAEQKDKQVRQSWAEGHKRLELREEAVHKMERKVNSLQSRASELSNYLQM